MKIAIATCHNIPEPDVDEALVLNSFRARGHDTDLIPWEAGVDRFAIYDAVVIRSTWNYPEFHAPFTNWVRELSVRTQLLNPADIVLGNIEKRYLVDLESRGIQIVPTRWMSALEAAAWIDSLDATYVLKPTIGAGSMDTFIVDQDSAEQVQSWLTLQDPTRMFMVQKYLSSVDSVGEQSIIVIGGEPTHRIRKHPRFADGEERVEGPLLVGEFDKIAQSAIEPIKDRILYARVDLMMLDDQSWAVSELELIEPSLFFTQHPPALQKLIDGVESMARST